MIRRPSPIRTLLACRGEYTPLEDKSISRYSVGVEMMILLHSFDTRLMVTNEGIRGRNERHLTQISSGSSSSVMLLGLKRVMWKLVFDD